MNTATGEHAGCAQLMGAASKGMPRKCDPTCIDVMPGMSPTFEEWVFACIAAHNTLPGEIALGRPFASTHAHHAIGVIGYRKTCREKPVAVFFSFLRVGIGMVDGDLSSNPMKRGWSIFPPT